MKKYDVITICMICLLLFSVAEALGISHYETEELFQDEEKMPDSTPIVSDPNPPHDSEGMNSTPRLSVLVEHPEDSEMDVSFYDNNTGDLIAVAENISDGDRAQVIWEDLNPDWIYSWQVIADDGENETEGGPWNFTTAGIDYVRITDEVNGTALTDKEVPPNYEEWGYLSAYNDTYGFFDTINGDWEASGDAELLGDPYEDHRGINVGEVAGYVWFNVTSDLYGYQDSVRYTVITDEVDHVKITDSPGGEPLENETVEVGHQVRGYCSVYNEEGEYLYTVSGNWSAEGADSSLLEDSFNESNVIDVGHEGGPVWFNLSYEGFNDSVRLDVLDPEPDEINITYEPDGEPIVGGEVSVGQKIWGNASGYNSTAGYIGTVEVEWSVESEEDMDPSIGPTPAESSWVDVGTNPGELFWNASYQKDNHWVNDSIQFIVVHGDAAYFEFDPIGTQTAGEPFTITITTYDGEDNVVTDYNGTAHLSDTTGTVEPETIEFTEGIGTEDVTITESHTEVTISAEDEDITGESDPFEVEPAEAVAFWIEPETAEIEAGESQAYTAYAEDDHGNEFEVTDETNWADDVDPEEASEWVDNEITVEVAGDWTITGEYGTLTDTAALEVTPGEPDHFGFDPIEDQSAGVAFQITITAYDEYDNVVTSYIDTVDITDTTETIQPDTVDFTEGTWTGDVTIMEGRDNVTITATDGIIEGVSSEFTVTPPDVEYIEITKDGEEYTGGIVPVNHSAGVELSAYNETLGHIGFVEGEWDVEGGDAFLLNGTYGMENEINVGTIPGEVILTAQYDDLETEVMFDVEEAQIDYIRVIEDPDEPDSVLEDVILAAGEELEGHSAGFNESVGFVDLVETNWLVNNHQGAEGSTSPSQGKSSVFDAGPFGGEAEWISEYEGYISFKVNIEILSPSIDQILIRDEPEGEGDVLEEIELEMEEEISLYPAGYNDTFGYLGDLEAEFFLDDEDIGELTQSEGTMTTFIPSQPGTTEITVVYEEIEATVDITVLDDRFPEIVGEIPDLDLERNFGIHEINLTEYASDELDDLSELKWFMSGINSSVISTYGENQTGNHVITLLSKEDALGRMDVRYWLENSAGNRVSQSAWINVTTEYEAPRIRRCPDLYVHYDEPYEFDYSPYIIYDEKRFDELTLETDDPEHTTVRGLKVTYEYPEDMLGEEVLVTITVSDEKESVSTVISVIVTSNSPPVEKERLPDITIEQGELKENVFDLDDYFTDPDGDPLYMSYGYTYLTITIHDNHSVDIRADGNWHGVERVTFRAKDPVGAIAEQTINVTVIPVNHPPEIKELPPFVVHHGEPYVFDLEYYISDPDNETSELTITTCSPEHVDVYGTELVMIYPEKLGDLEAEYEVLLEIKVSDGIETTSQVTTVTVGYHYPPELVIPLHDVAFKENEQLINAFHLDNHFMDRQNDTMYFTSGNENIEVVIHENSSVDFYAPENWNGQELITIRATNSAGALMEDSLTVTVIPVNNPPMIADIPRQEGEVGKSWILDMGDYISDVDNETHELEISVEDPYVEVYGQKLLFEFDRPGEYNVTVEVSDGMDVTIGTIEVYVVEPETGPWYSNNWVVLFGSVSLIGLIGAVLYLKKEEYTIEDIFLIHESGALIKHITRTLKAERDEDILAGMFTAVQNFVDDAFAEEEDEVLKRMEYGDKKVLVHKGDSVILAVFISGDEPKWALEGMKNLVSDIEERYGEDIEEWSGDIKDIPGIAKMLKALHKGRGKYEYGDWQKYSEE